MAIGDNKTYVYTDEVNYVEDVTNTDTTTIQPAEGEVWKVTGYKIYVVGTTPTNTYKQQRVTLYMTDGVDDISIATIYYNENTASPSTSRTTKISGGVLSPGDDAIDSISKCKELFIDNSIYLKSVITSVNNSTSAGSSTFYILINAVQVK